MHACRSTLEDPTVFVLCSSLSTVVGRFGQVDYTAANAYEDAFAHAHQAKTGTLTVAIDWGAWDEVGMAARPAGDAASALDALATFDHPLLQRLVVDEPKRKVFATEFSVATQWIVDEHRIIGIPAVPGVTYFEMVRAALAPRAAGRDIILSDVYFLAPLRVPEGETREARLVLDEDDAGFAFTIRGKRADGKLVDHTVGRARFEDAKPRTTVDLDAIRRRCDSDRHVSTEVEHEEDLGPRWRSVKKVYPGDREILVAIEMPEAFASDFEHLLLHPALLDRASGMAKNSLGKMGFYLPLTYRSLAIRGPLPRKIYSHARSSAQQENPDGETTAFDVTLLDEHGAVLVEIEGLTQKRVNDPGAEIRALAAREAAQGDAGAEAEDAREEIRPAEGLVALDRILASRVGARVVVSVRDLQATIEQTDRVLQERVLAAADRARPAQDGARPRPNLKTAYVAPRDALEEKIATAWQEVLGIDRVGVDDNFFDLGGDSVQAIQIIAKANQLGLKLNPQQFFQYSTIGELSEVLSGLVSKEAEQGAVEGAVPLTPWQSALLERLDARSDAPAHPSRAIVLEASERLDAGAVAHAIDRLVAHHDALRLRFARGPKGWTQSSAPPGGAPPIAAHDVAALPAGEQDAAVRAAVDRLHASLDLATGLFRAELLDLGARGARLVLAVHELVMDGESIAVLLEDLEAAYADATLPAKTASFKRWSERLASSAESTTVRNEVPFWLADAWREPARLPVELPRATSGGATTLDASLTPEETEALVGRTLVAYRAELREVLAAALGRAFARGADARALLVEIAGGARGAIDGVDVSRTVGPCEAGFPVRLEVAPDAEIGDALRGIKEQLRRTPNHGVGYGLLRWSGRFVEAADKLGRLPAPDVRLRHVGTIDAAANGASRFVPAAEGFARNPRAALTRAIEVESFVHRGRMTLRFAHGADAASRALVERVAAETLAALRALLASGDANVAFDATDFPLADLDADQLGALAALLDQADGLAQA